MHRGEIYRAAHALFACTTNRSTPMRGSSRLSWWDERSSVMRRFPPGIPARTESMAGPAYSNWIIKGHVLIGPHPGTTTPDIVKSLAQLLDAGVTTFVCLQAGLPVANITSGGLGVSAPPSRSRSAFGDGMLQHLLLVIFGNFSTCLSGLDRFL